MENEILTTLHPDENPDIALYPNIKSENVPNGAIHMNQLGSDVSSLLNGINELHPSGVDLSTNILAFTTNKGIYVGSDTGYWYYWNGTQYASGGQFLSSSRVLADLGVVISPDGILFNDANLLTTEGTYFIANNITSNMVANLPKYGVVCQFTNISTQVSSTIFSCLQIASYRDNDVYVRYITVNNGSATYNTGWMKIKTGSYLEDLGLITPSDIKFDNANTVSKNGSYFINSGITSSNIANLPRYGTSCIFTNMVIYFQPPTYYNTYAMHQLASYTDGEMYERVMLINNGSPSTAGWKKIYPSSGSAPVYANNVKVVDKNGHGDFLTIAGAVSSASDGDIIYIMPNIYDEHVVMNNKNITLKGFDKNNTFLVHTSKLYNDEPLQANMGVIENLTIIGAYNMTIEESDADAKSYAIHVDNPNTSSDPFSLKIENCNIISHSCSAIGIGCRYNQNILIKNCYIETTRGQYYSSYYSAWKNCGAIFCHNDGGGSNLGNDGYLSLENCELKGKITALTLQSQDNNNKLTLRFLKNILWSTTNGKTNAISVNNATTSSGHLAGNDIILDDISFGNNIDTINA